MTYEQLVAELRDECSAEGGCWRWPYGHTSQQRAAKTVWDRYGHKHQLLQRAIIALREDCELTGADVAMHTCDQPWCVNPQHIVRGTTKQNIHDCMRKGRFSPPPIKKKKNAEARS